ncbi:MAG: aminotransferase class V-fold PLP-dependent enzyme [Cyclobacteriaceae bacterium]|nr:aminotransferase class V-fold PLP-dependent enzyme [Cyclobacteriaceae bacterium]
MKCQKAIFSLPPEVSYLNCAYQSPLLRSVTSIGRAMVDQKATPFRIVKDDFFAPTEKLRSLFAQLIHAPDPKRVAIIPSASYGLATVARNIRLQKGQNIVMVEEQFPSNVYTWKRLAQEQTVQLKIVNAPQEDDQRGAMWNKRILEAIDEQTGLVTIGQVHWADGTLFDLEAIRRRTGEVGASLIIDGTQSIGAYPFDVRLLQPDAVICAGYKWLMGPYSIGLAWYGPRFDNGTPLEENWISRLNSEDFGGLVNYEDRYQPGALRYDVGENSNFILVPMLSTALEQILAWQVTEIQAYCRELVRGPIEDLRALDFKIEDEASRCAHLFGIRLPAHINMDRLKHRLQEEQIYVSYRGDAIRVSPHLYNEPHDLDRLVACFQEST